MNNRIRVAEAMGWKRDNHSLREVDFWMGPKGQIGEDALPDPENDANDDYAVLEWMRDTLTITQLYGWIDWHAVNYKKGDYYRAAVKVLEVLK